MSKRNKKGKLAGVKGNEALHADMISANEYTGFLQHIPVSNEDIELYKKMYGGGSFSHDEESN